MKSSNRYISDKKKAMENVGPLQKEMGDLVTWVGEKTEVFNDSFASELLSRCPSYLRSHGSLLKF